MPDDRQPGSVRPRPPVTARPHNCPIADLITKLLPILHVIAVGNDSAEFGITRRPGANPAASCLTWQLGASNIDTAIATGQQAGLNFEVAAERPREDATHPILKLRSPNSMEVLFQDQAPQP